MAKQSNNREALLQLIKLEKARCMIEPAHFIGNFCFISHPNRGKIKFELYDFQRKLLQEFLEHNKIVINKSRQLGISTLIAAYALWFALFHEEKNILILATKLSVARNILIKIQKMYAALPSWLKKGKAETDEKNKLSISFGNGSRIQSMPTTSDTGRSEAASLVIVDEAAYIKNMEETWGGIKMTTATGGQIIALSTPKGYGNWFHKTCKNAQEKRKDEGDFDTGFKYIELPWYLHPDRDQKWRDEQTEELGAQIAAAECDCTFLTAGQTVIAPEVLDYYEANKIQDPIEIRWADAGLWVWDRPSYTKQYIVAVDVARGDATDYSTMCVLDVEDMTQVAEYQGKITPEELGHLAVQVATEYNDALLVIENTGLGYAACQSAYNRGYKNLYYSKTGDDKIMEASEYISRNRKGKSVPGFATTAQNRPLMVSRMEQLMRQDLVTVRSVRLLNELHVFFWYGNKGQAQPGYNDDLVLAFMIALWTRDNAIVMKNYGLELTRKSLDMLSTTAKKPESSNYHLPGSETFQRYNEDINWLL